MKKLEELGVSPAPWKIDNGSDGWSIVRDAKGMYAATPDGDEETEAVSNSRLIAAAPELYDALQQIMQCWGASVFDEGGMACDTPLYCKHAGCGHKTCPVFLRAKDALAKAAGEEVADGK